MVVVHIRHHEPGRPHRSRLGSLDKLLFIFGVGSLCYVFFTIFFFSGLGRYKAVVFKPDRNPGPPSMEQIERLVKRKGLVVFTTTWYTRTDEVRFRMCLETIYQAQILDIPIVVVDGSPSEEVHVALQSAGAIVHRQTVSGKKGAALREAVQVASQLPGVEEERTYLCFQEPEKSGMVKLWSTTKQAALHDVFVPYRAHDDFLRTYPIEQFHSEMYGNHYLDTVANGELKNLKMPLSIVDSGVSSEIKRRRGPRVDWYFGPFAFKAAHEKLWTEYHRGDSYDAQVVPIVHAMRKGLSVASVHVRYEAPLEMQNEEENSAAFIQKRMAQLNDLIPKVRSSWTDEFYC